MSDTSPLSEQALAAQAYEQGYAMFMGVRLIAAPGALVPREETELLGNAALAVLRNCTSPAPTLIDMCCGSGNLACALAHHLPTVQAWACDLTDGCRNVTQQNVDQLDLNQRVHVAQGDLFASLSGMGLEGSIDIIVCNPPYISQGKLASELALLTSHEPKEAFDGGPYGLSIHQRVVKDAIPFLKPGGTLLFEIGVGQDRQVKILFDRTKAYENIRTFSNPSGQIRVLSGQKKSKMLQNACL